MHNAQRWERQSRRTQTHIVSNPCLTVSLVNNAYAEAAQALQQRALHVHDAAAVLRHVPAHVLQEAGRLAEGRQQV